MKVALVSPAWPSSIFVNGIATYVDLVRDGFAQINVETRVLAAATGVTELAADVVALDRIAPDKGFLRRVHDYALGRFFPHESIRLTYGRTIARAIKSLQPHFRPDVLEMEETLGTIDVVRSRINAPVVARLHGPYFLVAAALSAPQDAFYRNRVARERMAITRADGITSPSADTLDHVRREYGLELAHAEVIPNPAPTVPSDRRWNPTTADRTLILFVGRFDKNKGGDLIIEAFAKIAASRPLIRLAFIGPDWGLRDGGSEGISLPDFLADRVPDLSVRNRITYLGPMSAIEIHAWRLRAGVTVVPSRYETFSMTVVEAMAHGCPLLAARAGGIPEIVRHQENGLLFQLGSADDLAHWLTIALDNPDHAARLAEQGAADMQMRFASTTIAQRSADYYQRLLERVGPLRRKHSS